MNRRTYLASVGTAATLALAGCLGGDNERIELVEDYLDAVDDGDMELADSLVHSNGERPYEEQEDITINELEEWDREDVADATDHDLGELEEEDESLTEMQGFDEVAYIYGDIETGSDGDTEIYYRVADEDGLWYIMRAL